MINWKVDDVLEYTYISDAAKQGDGYGLYFCGYCNHFGVGKDVNYADAKTNYDAAIKEGIDAAANNLGLLYAECLIDGVSKRVSYQKAAGYFDSCYDTIVEAKHNMACMLRYGYGFDKDIDLAMQLFEEATGEGYITIYM